MDGWISNPDEDHGPLMSISCWCLAAGSAVFLALRLYIRHNTGKLWIDDLILGISWVILFVQVILNQLCINLGFGKHALDIDFSNLETITYYGATGLTLSTMAINLSKISFGVTLLKLTDSWAKWYTWFAIITLAAFAIPVAVLPWVQCKPLVKTFIDIYPGECLNKQAAVRFGEAQAVWAALMDFSLALIPWTILWNVQIRLTEKLGVGIAMSLGFLIGATSIVRAVYVRQLTEQDISYDATKSVIWSAAESAVTVIATSIPVLRVFLKKKVGSAIEYIHSSSSRSRNGTTQHSNGTSRAFADSIRLSNALSKKGASRNGSRSDPSTGSSKKWINLDDISETDDRSGKSATPEVPEVPRSIDIRQIPHSSLE